MGAHSYRHAVEYSEPHEPTTQELEDFYNQLAELEAAGSPSSRIKKFGQALLNGIAKNMEVKEGEVYVISLF